MNLTLSNFQIHQKPTTLEIPEGETTYVEGDSDIGKSSRLRAMRWLCENKPDGGSFVTFKQPRGTNARVMLEADGRLVMRERGKSANLYKLDGETFEAFGRSVPEPIAKFLNLSPYAFQCQGEVPFLIGASPTEAAKILSDACGLGVIDTAVQFVRKKKTVVEAEIRKSEILLESARARLVTATEQLPLADALEKAAELGDDAEEIELKRAELGMAIEDEPAGRPLDIAGVARSAALARSAGELAQILTGQSLALGRALRDEPTGAPFDMSPVFPIAGALHEIVPVLAGMHDRAARMRQSLAAEPTGRLLDVSAAKPFIGEARVLGGWLVDVTISKGRMYQALQAEPRGEVRDVSAVVPVTRRALAALDEAAMLDKMARTMRAALQNEPQGDLEDVTKLQQQRAQIKVCPTCGREL